jgi:transposase
VTPASESLPTDLTAAHAMILAERNARPVEEAEAASAHADLSSSATLIAHLKLEIEKLGRMLYGPRAERQKRLRPRTSLPPSSLPRRRRPCVPSSASGQCANLSR